MKCHQWFGRSQLVLLIHLHDVETPIPHHFGVYCRCIWSFEFTTSSCCLCRVCSPAFDPFPAISCLICCYRLLKGRIFQAYYRNGSKSWVLPRLLRTLIIYLTGMRDGYKFLKVKAQLRSKYSPGDYHRWKSFWLAFEVKSHLTFWLQLFLQRILPSAWSYPHHFVNLFLKT